MGPDSEPLFLTRELQWQERGWGRAGQVGEAWTAGAAGSSWEPASGPLLPARVHLMGGCSARGGRASLELGASGQMTSGPGPSRLSPWSQGSRHCAVGLTLALSSPGSGWPAGAGALSQRSGGLSVLKQQFCESVQGVLLLKWKKSLSTSLFSLPLSLSHIHTKGWNYHFPPIVIPAFTQHPSLVHLFPSAWTASHEPVTSCCQTTPGRDLCTFSVLLPVPEVPFPF